MEILIKPIPIEPYSCDGASECIGLQCEQYSSCPGKHCGEKCNFHEKN